jgi:hypothetical protein|nr:MAG TPA: hypothetical protein [Caudoviricetes sp.]
MSVTTQINIFSLKLSGKLFIPLPHVPHCKKRKDDKNGKRI